MDKKLLSIGETAKLLGVSIDTLRRWEKSDILVSFRPSPSSKRYYRQEDIELFLSKRQNIVNSNNIDNNIELLANEWALSSQPISIPSSSYCETNDIFSARLQHLEQELKRISKLQNIYPLIIALVGEIGNNSYNHNLGNWPDISGTFFAYDLTQRIIVLADRGRGIYATLKRVLPNLSDDQEALRTAFTQYISGRAPEDRGNGLKFVRDIVSANPLHLQFYTGNAKLELQQNTDLKISQSDLSFHGCLAIINY